MKRADAWSIGECYVKPTVWPDCVLLALTWIALRVIAFCAQAPRLNAVCDG
jgi:hypothetical protein